MTQRHFVNLKCLSFTFRNISYNSVQQVYVEELLSVQHWVGPVEGRKQEVDHLTIRLFFSAATK